MWCLWCKKYFIRNGKWRWCCCCCCEKRCTGNVWHGYETKIYDASGDCIQCIWNGIKLHWRRSIKIRSCILAFSLSHTISLPLSSRYWGAAQMHSVDINFNRNVARDFSLFSLRLNWFSSLSVSVLRGNDLGRKNDKRQQKR